MGSGQEVRQGTISVPEHEAAKLGFTKTYLEERGSLANLTVEPSGGMWQAGSE